MFYLKDVKNAICEYLSRLSDCILDFSCVILVYETWRTDIVMSSLNVNWKE